MNEIPFLFEFQSVRGAEHVMKESWRKPGSSLKLDWWSSIARAYSISLPLQLWSNRGYKGDWVKIWRMVGRSSRIT
ncbi:hypothetical protein H5410_036028 [Solanum commersonii]|uniref:Uncharacterized protein n=1 Tax=Solanum commersonii TaxID=4109 RepID=A0A9J5Y6D4_SOLCO|nr:hypothetical protein H5410_036028 [Solanum commersonii]